MTQRAKNFIRTIKDNDLIQKAKDAEANLLPICGSSDKAADEIRAKIAELGKEYLDLNELLCLRVLPDGEVIYEEVPELPVIDFNEANIDVMLAIATVLEQNNLAKVIPRSI